MHVWLFLFPDFVVEMNFCTLRIWFIIALTVFKVHFFFFVMTQSMTEGSWVCVLTFSSHCGLVFSTFYIWYS